MINVGAASEALCYTGCNKLDTAGQAELVAIVTGTNSGDDIAAQSSGLRPGAKLHEELLARNDSTLATPIRQLRMACLERREGMVQALRQWIVPVKVHGDAGGQVVHRRRGALLAQSRRHDRPAN